MAGETAPTRRRNLELVLRHMKAEARADIDSRKHEGSFCRVGALLVDRQFP